jgi:hypothetical protein
MRNDFEACVAHIVPYCPVAKKRTAGTKQGAAEISEVNADVEEAEISSFGTEELPPTMPQPRGLGFIMSTIFLGNNCKPPFAIYLAYQPTVRFVPPTADHGQVHFCRRSRSGSGCRSFR